MVSAAWFGVHGKQERGAALVVGLVMLALLTLMGATAYSVATQEERMAGNARDRIRAYEAAEAALRECERHLETVPVFTSAGSSGMYLAPPVTERPMWERLTASEWEGTGNKVRVVALPISNLARMPSCVAEQSDYEPSPGAVPPALVGVSKIHRVTVRAWGTNASTVVELQSTYVQ